MKIIKKFDCCFNESLELVYLDGSTIEGPYIVVSDDYYEELFALACQNSPGYPKNVKQS